MKTPTTSITKPIQFPPVASYWDTKFQFWQALVDDNGKPDGSIPANIVDEDLNNIDYNDRRAAQNSSWRRIIILTTAGRPAMPSYCSTPCMITVIS